jgi:hypothetical protein
MRSYRAALLLIPGKGAHGLGQIAVCQTGRLCETRRSATPRHARRRTLHWPLRVPSSKPRSIQSTHTKANDILCCAPAGTAWLRDGVPDSPRKAHKIWHMRAWHALTPTAAPPPRRRPAERTRPPPRSPRQRMHPRGPPTPRAAPAHARVRAYMRRARRALQHKKQTHTRTHTQTHTDTHTCSTASFSMHARFAEKRRRQLAQAAAPPAAAAAAAARIVRTSASRSASVRRVTTKSRAAAPSRSTVPARGYPRTHTYTPPPPHTPAPFLCPPPPPPARTRRRCCPSWSTAQQHVPACVARRARVASHSRSSHALTLVALAARDGGRWNERRERARAGLAPPPADPAPHIASTRRYPTTHTDTHGHTHKRTHTRTHARTHMHIHTRAQWHIQTR